MSFYRRIIKTNRLAQYFKNLVLTFLLDEQEQISVKVKQKIIQNLINIPGWRTKRKIVVIEGDTGVLLK